MQKTYKLILLTLLFASTLFAQQYTLSGVVTSAETGEKLVGANVFVKGTTIGAASDVDGKYSITLNAGTYTVVCSYVGFETQEFPVALRNNMELNFKLKDYQFSLSVTVLADRAKERETPVAFTNVDKKQMEFNLGSRDIPLVLNTTPSIYATEQGGGAGDSRVNLRGFDQRNIAIMINGVPINDMENGWVYWSNWDGLSDATSSIQVQRGLSAVNLATPSIGGTMNIISDPTQQRSSVFYKTETGSGNFSKQSVFAHTGLVDDKFAMSVGVVRKTGDGIAQGTYTDAWSYYLGAAYQLNSKNRLELYAMGAPQMHGQRTYRLNAASYSHELAKKLGISQEVLSDPLFQELGLNYNPNWNGAPSEYAGKQYYEMYWNTKIDNRYSPSYLWERENYFHKPLVNLNWYAQFTDKLSLYTTAYWSGGKGGGSGTYGSLKWDYSNIQRVADWNATINQNMGNVVKLDLNSDGDSTNYKIAKGILRNSVNQQWTIGAISKAYYKVNKDLTMSFGLDWRHAEIDHWREVRDLLGGQYFKEFAGNNQFESGNQLYKKLGDKINYNNTNTVDWFGGYLQGEYTADRFTFYGTAGYSVIKYDYEDHFRTAKKLPDGSPDISSGKLTIETDWIGGYQFKGGASFRATRDIDIYANAGYVSKVPIFDQVIDDNTGVKLDDPKNEKFLSGELGANFKLLQNMLNVKTNVYYTNWSDRAQTRPVLNPDGSDGMIRLDGIESTHMGFEADITFQPVNFVRLDLVFSKGIWEYGSDVSGVYVKDLGTGEQEAFNYYIKDLKVGDAPQTQIAAGVSLFPFKGFQAQLTFNYNDDYYSQYDPFSRTKVDDRAQVWKIPSFSVANFHISYNLPFEMADVTVFGHVFNLFDELYVADATDNSSFNAYKKNGVDHSADDAEIFPGLPRNFRAGFSIRF